ncbi:flagellar basal body P-ring formation chaperone FlgA [Qingshengfaniella alkalisoli]|uniref:Flagella basal body P-ring formation protein FlgA n=1 Tax=Qingshengfaniella alkalisoli TaxID=2599296 RepID=A0A5B8IVL3_9RHOB|nr:flagellar basal body P-ring formation chaperone FlgA [Qingshengfaniella alkalisoli]QDY70152.1 flagellar basal body P-ring formation protein FlgA [Qingshengfaniella alkalisoli]
MRIALTIALVCVSIGLPAQAETVAARAVIRAQTIIAPQDLKLLPDTTPGTLSNPSQVVGMEARVNLYPDRPIRSGDIGPPAVIERNQIVALNYHNAGLSILSEGRSLARAAAGERIRVMNLESRVTVTGTVMVDGSVTVGPLNR